MTRAPLGERHHVTRVRAPGPQTGSDVCTHRRSAVSARRLRGELSGRLAAGGISGGLVELANGDREALLAALKAGQVQVQRRASHRPSCTPRTPQ
jgi:hypothetical protein